jgi:hypothetical protein
VEESVDEKAVDDDGYPDRKEFFKTGPAVYLPRPETVLKHSASS